VIRLWLELSPHPDDGPLHETQGDRVTYVPAAVYNPFLLCRGFGNRLLQFVCDRRVTKPENWSGRLITGWSEVRALHQKLPSSCFPEIGRQSRSQESL